MLYTIAFLRKRYKLKSNKETIEKIKENLEQLNFEEVHAKTVNGNWELDEEGLRLLDVIMSYVDEEELQKQQTDANDMDDTSAPEQGQDDANTQKALGEIANLQDAVRERDEQIASLTAKLKTVNEQFLSFRDGSDGLASSMVREYQHRAEQAEERLKAARMHFDEMLSRRDEQISEMEAQIEECHKKLDEYAPIMEEKTKAVFEALQAKKTEQQLYADLRRLEKEKFDLSDSLADAKREAADATQRVEKLSANIADAVQSVRDAMVLLQVKVSETLGEKPEAEQTVEEAAPAEPNESEEQTVYVEPLPAIPEKKPEAAVVSIEEKRQKLIEKARQEQGEENVGHGFLHKIASFFSFF